MEDKRKRVRDDSAESESDFTDVKRIREDLLSILDDSDPDPVSQDLVTVMKAFEDELSPSAHVPTSGESQPDLGYLLEASDDELGLPPSTVTPDKESPVTELAPDSSESPRVNDLWGFEEQIPSYDSFESVIGESFDPEYLPFEGLFDFTDSFCDTADISGFSRWPESLPVE